MSSLFTAAAVAAAVSSMTNTTVEELKQCSTSIADTVLLPYQHILNNQNQNHNGAFTNSTNQLLGLTQQEDANQYLARLLMLDMLYVTTNGKETITQVPKCEILDENFLKQDSPQQFHLLSVQSPSTTNSLTGSIIESLLPSALDFKSIQQSQQPRSQHPLTCTACTFAINDAITAYIDDHPYHMSCVRCSTCEFSMGFEETCFLRDGNILCRADYMKKFRKVCDKCDIPIRPDDIVMKVRDAIFHIACFQCHICGVALAKGDMFTMSAQKHIFCHAHYDIICNTVLRDEAPIAERPTREVSEEPEEFPDDDSQSNNNRSKRMRTSFKHHQLRTMKQYFNLNHNPDAKDLKQLAQKTGLTKRVLQVWFQNARAKYRRSIQNRDGGQLSPGMHQTLIGMDNQQIGFEHLSSSSNHSSDYNSTLATPPDSSSEYYDNGATLVSL